MKKRTLILLLISLITLAVLGGVIAYGTTSLIALKEESSKVKGELDSWLKRSRDSSSLEDLLNEAKKVRAEIGEYAFVASEENQIAFISEIESIIKKTGTKGEVRSLDITPDYSKLICSVTFAGSWNDVYHTLLALEAYPIKINLDDVLIVEEKENRVMEKNDKIQILNPEYRANVKFTITSISKPK